MASGDIPGTGRGYIHKTPANQVVKLRRPDPAKIEQLLISAQNLSLNNDQSTMYASGDYGNRNFGNNDASSSTMKPAASNLNPNADVFIPRFSVNINTQPIQAVPQVNGCEVYQNDDDVEHINEYYSQYERRDSEQYHDDFVLLSELKDFIDLISSRPDQYDLCVDQVTDTLNRWTNDDDDLMLVYIVNTIVDQAILDPNFRYNGVRFCVHLMEHFCVSSTSKDKNFADVLLQRCQREYGRRESLAVATDGGAYLRGMTLFIADLSTRLENLTGYLPDLISTLLDHGTTENIKCACMTLKLCGEVLESSYKSESTFEQLMNKLENFSNNASITSSLKNLIDTVIQLRKNSWKTAPSQGSNLPNPYLNQENIVETYQYEDEDANDAPSYDFGHCGDEDSEDVCSAFDEFLRSSGQLE